MAWQGFLDTLTDPNAPGAGSLAGLFGGLSQFGAALSQAGQMRPLGQPGPGLADAFNAFSSGTRAGMLNNRQMRDMATQNSLDEALRPGADVAGMSPTAQTLHGAIPERIRPLLSVLPGDVRTQALASILTQKTNPKDNIQVVGRQIFDISSGKPVLIGEADDAHSAVRQAQEIAARAAGATRVNVDNRAPTAFEQAYGAKLADEAVGVLKTAETSQQTLDVLPRMAKARELMSAQGTGTGALAGVALTASSLGQALGIPPETLKAMGVPPDASPLELYKQLSNKLTMSMIGPGGIPANNFSEADRRFASESVPNLFLRPETNAAGEAALAKIAQRNIEARSSWNSARMRGIPYEAWQAQWTEHVNKTPLFSQPAAATPYQAAPIRGADPSAGYRGSATAPPAAGAGGNAPRVDYRAWQSLPRGAPYIAADDPSGQVRVKQ